MNVGHSRPETSQEVYWHAGEPAHPFPLLDYLQLLWFRRWLILVITLFVFLVGYIQVQEIKNVYSATATLIVGLPEKHVVDIEAVLVRDSYQDDATGEVEVLRSRGLAAKVIERLNLLNHAEFNPALAEPEESLFDFLSYLDPRTWIPASWKKSLKEALGYATEHAPPVPPTEAQAEEAQRAAELTNATNIFLGKLKVEQVEWTKVINITFSSLDPEVAARVANDLPEAYIVDQLEAKFEATEKANAWLTEQLRELEEKVVESERAVEIYRDEHGLAETEGSSILDAELSELNSQLIIARAERAEIDARLAQLQRLKSEGGQGVNTAAEVLSSTLIQQLRAQEAETLSRQSELAVEFGPKHPRMLQVQAEVVEIRERIHDEVDRIAAGLEHEAEFARTRVANLEGSVNAARGETSEQNREAIQMRALEREAAANRALYETFLSRFKETSSTQGLESSDARVISQAEVPGGPSYPNRQRLMLNYLLVGLLGSCGLVLLMQALNPGLTNPEQVQAVLGEFVIGLIPRLADKTPLYNDVVAKPSSVTVEAINSLKFSLALSDPDHAVKAVQVTSSVPEEGKTSLAIALARVAASSGQKVILVDGDLRRSTIAHKLGLDRRHKGLSDLVLAGSADFAEFVMQDAKGDVDYLGTGTAEFANASDIFSSQRMRVIVERLKEIYDLVVIDTPPVMAVADARIIGQVVDKTIFVVRWDKTPRRVARAAIDQLRRARVSLAGVVLQQVDLRRYGRLGYGESGYYYQYAQYGRKYYTG